MAYKQWNITDNINDNLPGSRGHSLSLENSIGVFPVKTQLELRNIIGILLKKKKNRSSFEIKKKTY